MSSDAGDRSQRRRRYRGTHPRRFAEKYKELQGDRQAVAHALAKGRTPAGRHRPVMVADVLQALAPAAGDTFLDATFGYGGHAEQLLPRLLPGGKLFALDVDSCERPRTEARLRAQGYGPEVLDVRALNFAQLEQLLPDTRAGFDGILADLGVSSMQLDDPARGFSYKAQGPLDLRLDPSRGMTAADFLQVASERMLATLLAEQADEPHAALLARALKTGSTPVATTAHLTRVVRTALRALPEPLPERAVRATLQRVFMALRLAVNDELAALDTLLAALPHCLRPGGRVAILTFHPGEERRVAAAFAAGAQAGAYARVEPAVRPSATEQRENPRCACARLHRAVSS